MPPIFGIQFPLREYQNPPCPENPGKLLKSYNLAHSRACPENYRKITKERLVIYY